VSEDNPYPSKTGLYKHHSHSILFCLHSIHTRRKHMQKDMHYYGTYALARAAGMKGDAARIVASASQFVDDSIDYDLIFNPDGSSIACTVTAHHALSKKNLDITDQRYIWVPFHFLPGIDGKTIEEKLVCVKDGPLAADIIKKAMDSEDVDLKMLTRIGITAHVYADTFSHYGFSGISSDFNKVHADSIEVKVSNAGIKDYLMKKLHAFFDETKVLMDRFIADNAEYFSNALGHGPVATCPDRPYLKWSFKYEKTERKEERDNSVTFMQGCENLYSFFNAFCSKRTEFSSGEGIPFNKIKEEIQKILEFEGTEEDRSEKWKCFVKEKFNKDIPAYKGDAWLKANSKNKDHKTVSQNDRNEAIAFHQAAEEHQYLVLKKLLPNYKINIV
jgi:hypothetical protein